MATKSSTITRSSMTRSASGDGLKEKRGTSPSNSHTQRKTITRSASAKEKSSTSSAEAAAAPLEKHIPNYLKPTISLSSRHDQSLKLNTVKKGSNGTTSEDQKLLRRRSFDKPPSSSPRVQKALISPPARPRDRTAPLPAAKERTVTVRSSSFSGRPNGSSTVSSRPVLDRSSTSLSPSSSSRLSLDGTRTSFAPKTPKAVKPQPVFTSRTTKKSLKAKECNASPSSSSSTKTLNQEAKQEEEKECHENREVNEDKVESEIEVHDHNDVMVAKCESNEECDHDHDNKTCDESTVLDDQNQAAHVEETEDKPHEEAKIEENLKEIDVVVVEADHDHHDHQHEEITQDGGEEKGEEMETSDGHEFGDENKVEEKAGHQDGEELGGGEEVAKQEAGNGNLAVTTPNKRPSGQGKKESPTAYNDVIEETASKLLEKRKNKVKALVGAFETVIDYESGTSK